jgi:UDPglucose 6-dehydrogenase
MTEKILIVGNGYVGKAYAGLFGRHHGVLIHDPPQGLIVPEREAARCGLAVVCVPTPMAADGSCDTSIVERAVLELPDAIPAVMIKSTVKPGTTDQFAESMQRPLVFSPEYIGEGGYWVPAHFPQPKDPLSHGFVILGASHRPDGRAIAHRIIDLMLPIVGPATRFRTMAAAEAEMVKYFENAFLAFKVTFANEMRGVCEAMGISYHEVREGWLDDSRIGLSHSAAFAARRGFDGKCLPKDTLALKLYCDQQGIATPLLTAMLEANRTIQWRARGKALQPEAV